MQQAAVKTNGPAAAAILAAGIGSAILGAVVTLAEAIPAVKQALSLTASVGPLSGKTTVMVAGWLLSWLILGLAWKGKEADFGKVWVVTLVLLALGFIGTFPVVFEAFTAH